MISEVAISIISITIIIILFIEFYLEKKLYKNFLLTPDKISYIPLFVKIRTFYYYGNVAKDLDFDNLPSNKQRIITTSISIDLARDFYKYGIKNIDSMDKVTMNIVRYYEYIWSRMRT